LVLLLVHLVVEPDFAVEDENPAVDLVEDPVKMVDLDFGRMQVAGYLDVEVAMGRIDFGEHFLEEHKGLLVEAVSSLVVVEAC
jgi:hypothetical protein